MKKISFSYQYKGENKQVFVTFARQKNVIYRYRKDGFHISAPYLTPKKFILKGLDKFSEKLVQDFEKRNVNFSLENDYIYLLGEKTLLSSLNLKNPQEIDAFLKKFALTTITNLVRKNEQIMGVKLPYKITIKNTSRQFGSNSKKTHRLSFQTSLIHFSEEIIESVVIHELAHEFERNHGENFYNIVYSYCPNYKDLQKKLKKGIYK